MSMSGWRRTSGPRTAVRGAAIGAVAVVVTAGLAALPSAGEASDGATHQAGGHEPATPVRHVVVVFQENVSFDHYFGTYPKAANADGQPFHARRDTPAPDGLLDPVTGQPSGADRTGGS